MAFDIIDTIDLEEAPILGRKRKRDDLAFGGEFDGGVPISSSLPDGTTLTVPPPSETTVPRGTLLGKPEIEEPTDTGAFPIYDPSLPSGEPSVPPPLDPLLPPPTESVPPPVDLPPPPLEPLPPPAPEPENQPVITRPDQMLEEPSPIPTPPSLPERLGLEGTTTEPITGQEVPERILPTRSQPVSELLERLQAEALRQLSQPSVYDDELFQQALELGQRRLDEYYAGLQRQLEADLARRGLSYGSTAGQTLADLATQRGRAFQEIMTPLLRERALALGQSRRAAADIARDLLGFRTALEAAERGELRGERSYLDYLREAARQQALEAMQLEEAARAQREAELQRTLALALGASDPTALLAALGQAGYGLGNVAAAYGQRAEASGQRVGQLAELLALLLAQQQGAQGATPPAPGVPISSSGMV